jgi:8-oxo-dGTP pyrophosphatase MutT (NUDIX family)/phosphohistidine phosphatase SixA
VVGGASAAPKGLEEEAVNEPVIRAAGGVLWRRAAGTGDEPGVEVAVVHRPRYDDWSLPKGKLAPGEAEVEGAVREVLEETGYRVRIGRPLGETRYIKEVAGLARPKVVRWWAMRAETGAFAPNDEIDDLRWCSLDEAVSVVTRDTDRVVLERFAQGPGPTRTVLVVRHATAGSSSNWPGEDRERPLDDGGWAQADGLARLLARFDVAEIVSADVVRCEQTVGPLAEALGLPIRPETVLSSVGFPDREDEAAGLVRALGAPGRDGVACSHGEVILDLLRRIAAADHLDPGEPLVARKGSVWALTFLEDRLFQMDYIDAPVTAERPMESVGI